MHTKTIAALAILSAFAGTLITAIEFRKPKAVSAASSNTPQYTKDGFMLPPANYREWIYLTTGLDMSYTPKPGGVDHSTFDNVFVNPEAYRSFIATGTWPDKTLMVLEARGAATNGSINKNGHFQSGDALGFEVHVKDESRPTKWAFYSFDSIKGNGTLIPQAASCYTCHQAHGAVDTTFVQFYPTLLPIAASKHTLSSEFLKEEGAGKGGK